MPLTQQLLGADKGADLAAEVAAATGRGGIRGCSGAPMAEIPGVSEDLVEAAARFADGFALRAYDSVQLAAPWAAPNCRQEQRRDPGPL